MSIVICYPNRIKECTVSDDNPEDWSTQLPLENVKSPILKKVARTKIGIRSTNLKINLSEQSRLIGGIAIANHNFTINAKVRFQGWAGLNFNGAMRFDSTGEFRAYPIFHPMGSGRVAFESRNFFLGTLEESERKSYTSLCSFYPPDNQMCQSIKITIVDEPTISATSATNLTVRRGQIMFTNLSVSNAFYSGQYITAYSAADPTKFMAGEVSSNISNILVLNVNLTGNSGSANDWQFINGDNFLQIGRIFLGKAVSPVNGAEYGDFSISITDTSEVQRSNGNTKYFFLKPKMRNVSLALKHLSQSEALSGFFDAQRELGLSGELLFTKSKPEYIADGVTNQNITKDANHYINTFLCNFSELNPVTDSYPGGFETVLKLEEIV